MAGVPTSDTNVSKPTSLQDALKQSSSSHNSLMPSPLIHGGQKSQSGKLAKFNPEKDHIWHDRYFILDQVAGTLVYYDDPVDASSPPQDPKLSIKVADITKVPESCSRCCL
ncbi:hypothetical protein M427DRAFT_52660 [Gonapodya prolifera JEL478]|uniref:PH domain-containing protein n=1 Tax=Gonapodya prolifera (strain JEL478) TaxID=1344416 RepID=A0A139AST4_GONPJ|nr:hypothetical protein M427DRAFT_52660 [Gonapodya prolifera JEL478]|eukprot:KXS19796.1 hypothetical protein M427DRAFT_52660 [Gonapodya prolifera JEL478]